MASVEYVVVANIIGDDLTFPDGTQRNSILGGAGTYAAAGMRIWSDRVGIVSGIGEDFQQRYGAWFVQNQIDTDGLQRRDANTPRSWIVYSSDDSRTETPQFGADHFKRMAPTINDMPASYQPARGLYLFRDTDPLYWQAAFEWRAKYHPVIIWEVHAGAANAEKWDAVAVILSQIDLFSINLAEASRLCQVSDPMQIVEKLLSTGVKGIALRSGATGSLVADQQAAWQIPVYRLPVVDVTGGGNAFTGGFLVGYCQSNADILTAGLWGAAAASFALEQFGPPFDMNSQVRHAAEARVRSLAPVRIG